MRNYFNTPTDTLNPLVGHITQVYAYGEKPKGHAKGRKLEKPGNPGQIMGKGSGGEVALGVPYTMETKGGPRKRELGK